jgi:hypothetical protein
MTGVLQTDHIDCPSVLGWRPALPAAKTRSMQYKPNFKAPSEQAVRQILERYACPVPYHELRTRFLGLIATPLDRVAPMQVVKDLWGGELPAFDSIDDLNELLDTLINGLWNDLTKHQKRSAPFRLVRPTLGLTAIDLGNYALIRQQEIEGFIEGLFNGKDRIDLPERAHEALGHLGELRAMMAGICDLVERDAKAESKTALETTFKHVRELTRIMEAEIHEAVLSCSRARREMLEGVATENPTLH